ncbi:hypothetical protein FLK63_31300 [Burkholderia gladioli]|nr:hypothetical protein [Burkholderia gladioli]
MLMRPRSGTAKGVHVRRAWDKTGQTNVVGWPGPLARRRRKRLGAADRFILISGINSGRTSFTDTARLRHAAARGEQPFDSDALVLTARSIGLKARRVPFSVDRLGR